MTSSFFLWVCVLLATTGSNHRYVGHLTMV